MSQAQAHMASVCVSIPVARNRIHHQVSGVSADHFKIGLPRLKLVQP